MGLVGLVVLSDLIKLFQYCEGRGKKGKKRRQVIGGAEAARGKGPGSHGRTVSSVPGMVHHKDEGLTEPDTGPTRGDGVGTRSGGLSLFVN